MVVLVLTTSCHVSLKPKSGPEAAHATISTEAPMKVAGRPAARAVHLANRVKCERVLVGLIPWPRHAAVGCRRFTTHIQCQHIGPLSRGGVHR